MYHTIYKTTNLINDKIYIGYHKTTDLNDGYLGSGKILEIALKKYGRENFKKDILYIFPSKEEALLKETELVNAEFVESENNYNIKIGGEGGWDYINNLIKTDPVFKERVYGNISSNLKNLYKLGILDSSGKNNPMYGRSAWNRGLSLTAETKNKISENNGNKLNESEISERLNDLKETEAKRGYISYLAKKWSISHTQVKRFIKKFGDSD
jgi:hypothetical protein